MERPRQRLQHGNLPKYSKPQTTASTIKSNPRSIFEGPDSKELVVPLPLKCGNGLILEEIDCYFKTYRNYSWSAI